MQLPVPRRPRGPLAVAGALQAHALPPLLYRRRSFSRSSACARASRTWALRSRLRGPSVVLYKQ